MRQKQIEVIACRMSESVLVIHHFFPINFTFTSSRVPSRGCTLRHAWWCFIDLMFALTPRTPLWCCHVCCLLMDDDRRVCEWWTILRGSLTEAQHAYIAHDRFFWGDLFRSRIAVSSVPVLCLRVRCNVMERSGKGFISKAASIYTLLLLCCVKWGVNAGATLPPVSLPVCTR